MWMEGAYTCIKSIYWKKIPNYMYDLKKIKDSKLVIFTPYLIYVCVKLLRCDGLRVGEMLVNQWCSPHPETPTLFIRLREEGVVSGVW